MSRHHVINALLVAIVGVLLTYTAAGDGANDSGWFSELIGSIGGGLLGGVVIGIFLFASFGREQPSTTLEASEFTLVKQNQDMGSRYWLDFLEGIDRDQAPVWFVGRRNELWIKEGLPYRERLTVDLAARLDRSVRRWRWAGNTYIVVTDPRAFEMWKEFIDGEVKPLLKAGSAMGSLFLGHADGVGMRYSAVAHGREVIVTTQLTKSQTAVSPTFSVDPASPVGQAYLDDFGRVAAEVGTEWWPTVPSGEG
jgi:hypothetical protein